MVECWVKEENRIQNGVLCRGWLEQAGEERRRGEARGGEVRIEVREVM